VRLDGREIITATSVPTCPVAATPVSGTDPAATGVIVPALPVALMPDSATVRFASGVPTLPVAD
jgi:hypothetical protein